MTSKSSGNKRHGAHRINERRIKTTPSKRNNKAKARERREMLKEKGLNC